MVQKFINIFVKLIRKLIVLFLDKETEKEKQIESQKAILCNCINLLSSIRLLRLRQAVMKSDHNTVYMEVTEISDCLMDCMFWSMPIVYKYGENDLFDDMKYARSCLIMEINFLENYILRSENNEQVGILLDKCANNCYYLIKYLKEKLMKVDEEVFKQLIVESICA